MKFKLTLLSLFMAAALPALAQTPVYLDTNKSVEERGERCINSHDA